MIRNLIVSNEIKEIDCLIGSGVLADDGKEIFEGDLILDPYDEETILTVAFHRGTLELQKLDSYVYDLSAWDDFVLQRVKNIS